MQADALIASVKSAAGQALNYAQSASDPTLKATLVHNANDLNDKINHWATDQLARVQSGEKPESWWTDYGQVLLKIATSNVADNGSFYAQYSRALMAAGDAAQAVETAVQGAIAVGREKIDKFKGQLVQFDESMAHIQDQRATLQDHQDKLSPDARDVLFGAEYDAAYAALGTFRGLVEVLIKVFDAIDSGHAIAKTGDDFTVDDDANAAAYSMGNPIAVGAGGVIAAIAIAASIAASLLAYFNHANQVMAGEESSNILDLVKSGKLSAADAGKVADSLAKLHKSASPDPLAGAADTVKAVVGGVVVVGVVYVGVKYGPDIVKFLKELFGKKRAAA